MTPDAIELTGTLEAGQTAVTLERPLTELPAGPVRLVVRPLPAGPASSDAASSPAGLLGETIADTLHQIHAFLDARGARPDTATVDAHAAEARAGWDERDHRLEEVSGPNAPALPA